MGVGSRSALHFAVACIVGMLIGASAASAAPYTTVERTIQDCDGDQLLEFTFGEAHIPFADAAAGPAQDGCSAEAEQVRRLRLAPDASIINFLQLSDFQIVDEESPARVEWLDATQRVPRLQPFSAAYRPQESLTTQVTEAMIRQARNTVSPVTSKQLELTILTGDNADSQQYNETRWFINILDGTTRAANPDPENETPPGVDRDRKIDPNSGIPTPACPGTPGSIYDGVRDSGQSGVFPDGGYYEPDTSVGSRDDGDGYSPVRAENLQETPGRDVRVRDYAGLFERANEPFEALGLDMPWYSAFGNHDALIQGNSPEAYFGPTGPGHLQLPPASETFNPVFHNTPPAGIATGCVKVMQPATATAETIDGLVAEIEALRDGGTTPGEQEDIDELTGTILGLAAQPCDPATDSGCEIEIVPPDARRCFLAKDEPMIAPPGTPCETGSWIRQHFRTTGTPVGHGFANRPPEAERNNDGYYAFSPKPGLRFIVLDTITDECGLIVCSEGSVDDAQFQWLRGQIESAAANGQYVLTFSHHTLRTIRFPSTDLSEHPTHNGQAFDRRNLGNPQSASEGETLEELYCRYPNLLAHVAGHEHENYVQPHECANDRPPPPTCGADPVEPPPPTCPNPYFWEISTAAHIDWPQQARMIELVDLGGEMSFVLTILDHEGPPNPMGRQDAGRAPGDIPRLAGIGREIAYNDYQADRGARGGRQDRNVLLPTDRPPPPYTP